MGLTGVLFGEVGEAGLLVTTKLDPLALVVQLIEVHGVIVAGQQQADPGEVQCGIACAGLLIECCLHQVIQLPVVLVTEATLEAGQGIGQVTGKLWPTRLAAVHFQIALPEILHVIHPDLLGSLLLGHLNHHQGGLAHGLIEVKRQGAATDEAALVFHHEGMFALVAALEQLYGQPVFEVDVAGLASRQLAKGGSPVMGVPFQIHRLGNVGQHVGLAGACHAGQHVPVALGAGALLGIDEKAAQLLVAAGHPRADDTFISQPLLHCLRAQATAKTVEQGIGLLVLYVVITVIRQYIEPKIVGQTLGVNPLVTLMGLYFGLKIFGFIGMFLVPLAVMTVKAFNDTGRIHLYNPPARERAAAEATLRAADQPKKPLPNPFKKKK